MEIEIGELLSTIHTVDGDSVLAPQTMEKIIRAVLRAVQDGEEHRKRVRAEQRITGGIAEEQEEES